MKKIFWLGLVSFLIFNSCKIGNYSNILFETNFESGNLESWISEIEEEAGVVRIIDNSLEIDVEKGATVWFKSKLTAPVIIEYLVTVVDKGGKNDRVSDLNNFWMATDSRCKSSTIFCDENNRKGNFGDYHKLKTYYVGYGGHDNTKTRFRRYAGNGERPLLPEHDLSKPYLIVPNETFKISITVQNNRSTYSINDSIVFDYQDPEPLTEGYFAFRTVSNHMKIHHFKVSKL